MGSVSRWQAAAREHRKVGWQESRNDLPHRKLLLPRFWMRSCGALTNGSSPFDGFWGRSGSAMMRTRNLYPVNQWLIFNLERYDPCEANNLTDPSTRRIGSNTPEENC